MKFKKLISGIAVASLIAVTSVPAYSSILQILYHHFRFKKIKADLKKSALFFYQYIPCIPI